MIPPHRWIDSYYYSGPISRDIYPFWKEKFIEVCEDGVSEVVLYGSIGGGKTYFANVLLIRKLYELSCLEDPWRELGIAKGSPIFFLYFSVTLRQARMTGFEELMSLIDSIPYFREKFRRDENVSSYLRFPKNIFVLTGSKFEHQIGMNILGAVLDEGNFRLAKDKFEDALKLYNTVNTRRLSRFVKGGKDLGISVLISSAKDPTSFVERKIEESKSRKDVKVIRVRGYEVKGLLGRDDDFWVFLGEGNLPPQIVNDTNELSLILKRMGFEITENSSTLEEVISSLDGKLKDKFAKVPGVFRKLFESDVRLAVRDVIGVGVVDEKKLFKVSSCVEEASVLENPFYYDVVELSLFDDMQLWHYLDLSKLHNFDVPRFIHVDIGLTRDRTGIACCYPVGWVERRGQKVMKVAVEFVVGVQKSLAYSGDDQVPIWKIRDFVIWLREKGVNVQRVTFDGFQSVDTMQLLRRAGITCDYLSVDRSDEVYLNLLSLYLEGRIICCKNKVYEKELLELEWDSVRKKVDHPVGGTKDLADAVAGACFSAVKNATSFLSYEEFVTTPEKDSLGLQVLDQLLDEAKKRRRGKWWEMW